MGVLRPNLNGSLLKVHIHLHQDLVPVPLGSFLPLSVPTEGVEHLLLLLLLQVFLYLYRSCQVSVVLLALAQEPEILVKSFSEHSPLTLA